MENGNPDYNFGLKIVQQACKKPFEQILTNAGFTEVESNMLAQHELIDSGRDTWKGFNIKTKKVTNMKEAGIIDPLKVTRTALEAAASVAGTLLLTETVIADNPEDKKEGGVDPSLLGLGM